MVRYSSVVGAVFLTWKLLLTNNGNVLGQLPLPSSPQNDQQSSIPPYLKRADQDSRLHRYVGLAPRTKNLYTHGRIFKDGKQDLWAIRKSPLKIVKWSGEDWLEVTTPPLNFEDCHQPTFDSKNQLWMLHRDNKASAVYDATSNRWHTFGSSEAAVESCLTIGDLVAPAAPVWAGVISHPNGTIGFASTSGSIHVRLNQKWHQTPFDVVNGSRVAHTWWIEFTKEGKFCIIDDSWGDSLIGPDDQILGPAQFTLETDGTWTASRRPHHPRPKRALESDVPLDPTGFPDDAAWKEDPWGSQWMLRGDYAVLKRRAGIIVEWGQDYPTKPPRQSRYTVFVFDRFGNAHFSHQVNYTTELWITLQSLPAAPVKAALDSGDPPRINITAPEKSWRRWRVKGGDWQKLAQSNNIVLNELVAGDHLLEIEVLDRELGNLKEFSDFRVHIQAAPVPNIATWIGNLADKDLSKRENASLELRKQAAAAVPALRAALEYTTDESHRWWIESVLEAIETKRN